MKSSRKTAKTMGGRNDAAMILWPFVGFAEQGDQTLFEYMRHVGIQIDALEPDDKRTPEALILEHYRLPDGTYDVDLAGRDLLRWPSIAARVHEMKAAQASSSTTQKISLKSRKH